jgi:hypothetical protein
MADERLPYCVQVLGKSSRCPRRMPLLYGAGIAEMQSHSATQCPTPSSFACSNIASERLESCCDVL